MDKGEDCWKETVRDIYDEIHFREDGCFSGNRLAWRLIKMIEDRHPEWFCEKRTKGEQEK